MLDLPMPNYNILSFLGRVVVKREAKIVSQNDSKMELSLVIFLPFLEAFQTPQISF